MCIKKLITLIAILFSFSATAQTQDSTVIVTTSKDTLIYILNQINANVDSKKISAELIAFLTKRIQIVATKPK